MDIILPDQCNEQKFLDCAAKIQYDEFHAKMFLFFAGYSDVDVYQLIPDDRTLQLIYGWEACHIHSRERITEELVYIVRILAHHTLQLWFSQEWIGCSESLKRMLIYYISKGYTKFNKIKGLCNIDWPYILNYQMNPWRLPYLQQLFANLMQNKHNVIEHAVPPATPEDITFLMQERLHLIILRLLKLFDAGSWEAVKQLSLRVLAAWLKCYPKIYGTSLPFEQTSIVLVAHLYLLTVFVADDNRGYNIDNMMYNIRFYAQSMQEASNTEAMGYTPARLIAQICVRLGLGKDGFFEYIVFKRFHLNPVTSFAVMLEAYTSYVLGNQLLELMALNEHDFMAHLAKFKVLMHCYVEERENSERFLLNELQKLECQRNSHALPHTVNLNLNYQQQICKGNRASNIGNYKNYDDDEKPLQDVDEELDRQIDPVFQNVPNNEKVLDFVYKLLAQRKFRGWQFAKIAILLKIIGQKLNTIEVWRYHPGLTTQFMLNLEHNLSDNYADLAKVFSEHAFMEAEFWLTAFYLHPTRSSYYEVKRCSRIKKKRKDDEEVVSSRAAARPDKLEQHIKYELLSSTIDVDEIVAITNHNSPVADYDPISKALQTLRLPRSILKDLLTVAFQPRNKRYSWALEWNTLHERCSALLKSTDLKQKFVALNMAEANDDLKYLKIDYEKYKNRPQLDYGTIEEGYENAVNAAEGDAELSADEDEEAQKPPREKNDRDRKRHRIPVKFWKEVSEDEDEEEQESDESEAYYTGSGRRTRFRAAALVANTMISDMDRAMRSGRRSPAAEPPAEPKTQETEQSPVEAETSKPPPPEKSNVPKRSIGELLQSQAKYTNETSGFKAFSDIWSFEKVEELNVEVDDNVLMESNSLLSKFKSLQGLRRNAPATTTQLDTSTETAYSRTSSRYNSETDSLESGASMMAMHDANEFEEGQSEAVTGVSKVFTPPPEPTSDFTMETEVLQLRGKSLTGDEEAAKAMPGALATEERTVTEAETEPANQPAIEKQPSNENVKRFKANDSSSQEPSSSVSLASDVDARLIQECLSRQLEVRLHMLSLQDIEQLRGLRVRVKRTNLHHYYRELKTQQEHSRSSSTSKQSHTDGSNASTPTSEVQSECGSRSKVKKEFVHITSDTADPKAEPRLTVQLKRFKHITSDSSTEPDEPARPASLRRRRRGNRWSQTKIKVNPAKLAKVKHVTGDTDVIELSSESTSSSQSPVPVTVSRFPAMVVPSELDPLYEEEIVPF
ncbi:hypothetical protein AWZ03_000524 [Drosophila navojoa]|uniref:Uncharacterized protein n=1 Tax=Drosophila navojoa TaxID=7232 RepID=A0A484C062_DRONA|nr:uncharacterized protein LOC108652353 isoform X1 [Drosophila navojoa]TDG52981.1 hypothetical protein AWZ03_000524 [Drosophila navojoa]